MSTYDKNAISNDMRHTSCSVQHTRAVPCGQQPAVAPPLLALADRPNSLSSYTLASCARSLSIAT